MDIHTAVTVSDLTNQIKGLLEGSFPERWVEGEISNFKHHSSGHMYFTLKDSNAELRCVMFRGYNQYLRFKPKDGLKVLLNGKITVYAQRGQYQLVTSRMEPAGLGTLYLAFEALKKQLSSEGLFAVESKKLLPKFPQRIGLITSKTSAAVRDMFQVFKRRSPYVELVLHSTHVQGDSAAGEISEAIQKLDSSGNLDLIILGRGGGSLEDLWPFNEEKLARTIFACNTPIISAVGHETDITISDLVADVRAATPSAGAELAAPSVEELIQKCDYQKEKLTTNLLNLLENCWQKSDQLHDRFTLQFPEKHIARLQEKSQYYNVRIKQSMLFFLQEKERNFSQLYSELNSINPHNILNRGYAIASKEDGSIIHGSGDVQTGEVFNLTLAKDKMDVKKCSTLEVRGQKSELN